MELSKNKEQVICLKEAIDNQYLLPGSFEIIHNGVPQWCAARGLLPRHKNEMGYFFSVHRKVTLCSIWYIPDSESVCKVRYSLSVKALS